MIGGAVFSSKKHDWETPDDLFNEWDDKFGFTIDVCATKDNAKLERFFSPEEDGLSQSWQGEICWMNPPYSDVGKWMEKACKESEEGATVVCLVPARTDTKWFHDYVLGKAVIFFLKGRIKFVGAKSSAPFPSMIVIYRGE